MTTWVLVANRTEARLFERQGMKLRLLRSIPHPAGRQRDQDIEANRSARTFDKHARGHTHETSPHEHSAEAFARELAGVLAVGRTEHGVGRVALVAEPHFLGLLRAELDAATDKLVTSAVPKDLIAADDETIRAHLKDVPAN